jgi:hypothetical protein
MKYIPLLFFQFIMAIHGVSQHISEFTSVIPTIQNTNFVFPFTTHKFQKILEQGDPIGNGTVRDNFDFTGYLSANGSSTSGYLALNHEIHPGAVTAMDINFNGTTQLWNPSSLTQLDFSAVNGTSTNCSGGITPWGTTITCEETITTADTNGDGYYDFGWMVEINPVTKTVIRKLWALGCGKKENITIHSNRRTAYFGNDSNPGYLYKFVANTNNNLNDGVLLVYKGSKNGNGEWIPINNTSISDRNNTLSLCNAAGATVFNGIEDVEIGLDGKIYLAVKNENCVYRFSDSDPVSGITVSEFETYAGNMSYNITHAGGTTLTPWGAGNDNLAFDNLGNLWVLQDGGNNYIWVVMNNHTQANPNVKIFGIAPGGSEPTGITFTPDYKYLFMSIQHPLAGNNIDYQTDAAGNKIGFGNDIAIVIALSSNLGCNQSGMSCNDNNSNTYNDKYSENCICTGTRIQDTLNISVKSGNDDAEENLNNGTVSLTSTDLNLGYDGAIPQLVAIKFNNINIPKKSFIQSANIQFTSDEITAETTTVIIKAEKSTSPLPITNSPYNLSQRTPTTDSVTWQIPAWNAEGQFTPDQKSPGIQKIIQELVSREDWSETGSSIVLLIKGNGTRIAKSQESSSSNSAVLQIEYTVQNVNNVGIGQTAPASKLQVKNGDIYVETIGAGVILKSPDGKCWKLTVTNAGAIQAISVPCPGF